MRLVVVSDLHLDWISSGVHRFEEVESVVNRTVEAAIDRKADAWVFPGDAMNPDSGSCVFRCLDVLVRAAVRLHRNGVRFIAVAGNHDVVEDGRGDTTLSPLRAIPGVQVFNEPGSIFLEKQGEPVVKLVALPYTSTSRSYDPAQAVGDLCDGDGRLVVVGHLNVRGVVPGSETTEMPRGREVWLPDDELAVVARRRSTLVINGHYHRQQRHVTPSGLEVLIPGSAARLTHGEEANDPSFLVVDL